MKTSNPTERTLKSSILFFTISALILSALLFTSCSDNESVTDLEDDTTLIERIETASKTAVDASSLPSATASTLNGDLADSFVDAVELATGLGYKVSVETFNAAREEDKSDVFFTLEGRQLNDTNEKRRRRRNKCFEFVFPIDFIMPDDSSITLNSKDDWSLIKDWYDANPDADERPSLVFPVDIILKEDGSTQTLLDADELSTVKQNCRVDKDKRKCFKLVLPVTFTMPDATEITVNERSDFRTVRGWYKANPDATEKATLNFPVDIEYRDGTTATINDQAEFDAAKDSCQD